MNSFASGIVVNVQWSVDCATWISRDPANLGRKIPGKFPVLPNYPDNHFLRKKRQDSLPVIWEISVSVEVQNPKRQREKKTRTKCQWFSIPQSSNVSWILHTWICLFRTQEHTAERVYIVTIRPYEQTRPDCLRHFLPLRVHFFTYTLRHTQIFRTHLTVQIKLKKLQKKKSKRSRRERRRNIYIYIWRRITTRLKFIRRKFSCWFFFGAE